MPLNNIYQPAEQLLMDVSEFSPVLPDSVTQLLLTRSGLDTETDPRIARIAALAAQKVWKFNTKKFVRSLQLLRRNSK
jgi:hypothetical protein